MEFQSKPIPKYYQIYEELVEQIRSGSYREGDRFPGDTELVHRYGVSRGTIREALKLLFQQGYLIREQGKGTFVTFRKIEQNPDHLIGFSELMRRHNIRPSARLIQKKVTTPNTNLLSLMNLKPSDKVVRIVRLRFGDEQPLIIERSFFNYLLFEPILDQDLEHNSIYELLYACTDTKLGDALQRIEAISAGQTEHQLLGVSLGTPLLLIKRLIKTSDDEYFQYSEDVYRNDRINFTTQTISYEKTHNIEGLKEGINRRR